MCHRPLASQAAPIPAPTPPPLNTKVAEPCLCPHPCIHCRLVQNRAAAAASGSEAKPEAEETAAPAPADEEDEDVELSAEGLDEEEVKLVMSQANVSRNKAIKALKQENDLVSAILSLTPT